MSNRVTHTDPRETTPVFSDLRRGEVFRLRKHKGDLYMRAWLVNADPDCRGLALSLSTGWLSQFTSDMEVERLSGEVKIGIGDAR